MPGGSGHLSTPAPLDLDAVCARTGKATPGPWVADDTDLKVDTSDGRALVVLATVLLGDDDTRDAYPQAVADTEFIAHARTDVPLMVEELRKLRAAVRRVVSITQDTDGDALNNDETVPVGEVLRMLYEFHGDVVERAFRARRANEPGA
jgi:hypothetical protein